LSLSRIGPNERQLCRSAQCLFPMVVAIAVRHVRIALFNKHFTVHLTTLAVKLAVAFKHVAIKRFAPHTTQSNTAG